MGDSFGSLIGLLSLLRLRGMCRLVNKEAATFAIGGNHNIPGPCEKVSVKFKPSPGALTELSAGGG